jgi:hypothetical protein
MVLAMVPAVVPAAMIPAMVPAVVPAMVPAAVAMVAMVMGLCLRSVIWIPIMMNAFLRTSLTQQNFQKTLRSKLLSAQSQMTTALRRFLKQISMP